MSGAESELESKFQKYFIGFEKIAEAVENYLHTFPLGLRDNIRLITQSMVEAEAKLELNQFTGNIDSLEFYKKLLRRITKTILWDLEQSKQVTERSQLEDLVSCQCYSC